MARWSKKVMVARPVEVVWQTVFLRRWRIVLWLTVGPLTEGRGGVGVRHDGATVVCHSERRAWCSGWWCPPLHSGALRRAAHVSDWPASNPSTACRGGCVVVVVRAWAAQQCEGPAGRRGGAYVQKVFIGPHAVGHSSASF